VEITKAWRGFYRENEKKLFGGRPAHGVVGDEGKQNGYRFLGGGKGKPQQSPRSIKLWGNSRFGEAIANIAVKSLAFQRGLGTEKPGGGNGCAAERDMAVEDLSISRTKRERNTQRAKGIRN